MKTAHDDTATKYCLCDQPDDGSPMVCCSLCNEWYHFRCVNLGLEDASELEVYVCPTCHTKTGRRSISDIDGHQDASNRGRNEENSDRFVSTPPPALLPSESEEEADSEDEYVAEPEKAKGKSFSKRRARKYPESSDSDEQPGDIQDGWQSSRKGGNPSHGSSERKMSPASSSQLKRKSTAASQTPAAKRRKSSDGAASAEEDVARKYCLGKLQEMFLPVFLRYPSADSPDGSGNKIELKPEDLDETGKQRLENEAKTFASELEQSIFDIYAEPDKHGKLGVGPKYKERFRMLTFNLSQADRVAIHKRICFSSISAKELAFMSSTDLANEETKQSIKMAEQEALEHSILQKTTVPRAKITHKGLQDIEDVNGEATVLVREREKEREREEEERRERERQARHRAAEQHQKQQTNAISHGSVPPESPITSHGPAWGDPPSATSQVVSSDSFSPTVGGGERPAAHSLFAHPYQMQLSEPELDIADLIHFHDEEPSPREGATDLQPTAALEGPVTSDEPVPSAQPDPSPLELSDISSPTAHDSVAETQNKSLKPETPVKTTFDLNALWSAPKEESVPQKPEEAPVLEPKDQPMSTDTSHQEATDQDFDMFLEKEQEPEVKAVEDPEAPLKAMPTVWHGKIALPLDSPVAEEAHVTARQVGGRNLDATSILWKTLFVSDTLRIEGRVQTDVAAQFLLQMRLNPQKELIACAFLPEPADAKLQTFIDFLLKKNRHGLVFPWGQSPKDHHPGKELYLVPLRANAPLPDYMELLDDLRLPKVRTSDIIVGIWILVKGKLTALPALPPPPVVSSLPPVSTSFNVPGAGASIPPQPQPHSHAGPISPLLPAMQAYPQLANPALAAEVAALSPEQIQAILQALPSSNGVSSMSSLPMGVASALGNTSTTPQQPRILQPGAAAPPQWNGGMLNFPPFSPNPVSVSQFGSQPASQHSIPSPIRQPPSGPSGRGVPNHGHYDHLNDDRDFRRGPGYDRGDRGGWQGGRGRGRGRGWGRGSGPPSYRPVDSGWGRGRGQDDGGRPDTGPQQGSRRW
ncbi:hypothetical protein F5J12DRAFT_724472 [Pisolithus orientalis]|uniref:uncharacterized protein n=1 Tax=Pisolithus orientalis TaxID=936130 RepID=UPI002225838E|nr:uncharacterized protein F5J12DRAFT_724472 [Pisolithus orientalis]KAI5999330.1 hypothetical protein F5J12DRAFT_724472 [Pisolithus orientalis]